MRRVDWGLREVVSAPIRCRLWKTRRLPRPLRCGGTERGRLGPILRHDTTADPGWLARRIKRLLSAAKGVRDCAIEVFQHLADQVVHGIEALEHKHLLDAERRTREQAQKSLTEALSASVSAMVTAMEMRDPYTAGHENRTADIAYAIGKEMGWPEGRLQGLRMAAMVHDIGKISIPSEC